MCSLFPQPTSSQSLVPSPATNGSPAATLRTVKWEARPQPRLAASGREHTTPVRLHIPPQVSEMSSCDSSFPLSCESVVPTPGLPVTIEELEDARQDHWHHATVIAIHLEVVEHEVAAPHELCERTASFERGRRPGPLRHEDWKPTDQVERIRRCVDEWAGHGCHCAPALGVPSREMPCATAAHRMAHEERPRPIGPELLRHEIEDGDYIELTEAQLPLPD